MWGLQAPRGEWPEEKGVRGDLCESAPPPFPPKAGLSTACPRAVWLGAPGCGGQGPAQLPPKDASLGASGTALVGGFLSGDSALVCPSGTR